MHVLVGHVFDGSLFTGSGFWTPQSEIVSPRGDLGAVAVNDKVAKLATAENFLALFHSEWHAMIQLCRKALHGIEHAQKLMGKQLGLHACRGIEVRFWANSQILCKS